MAAASFTAAKFLAPVAARSGGDRAPLLTSAGAVSARPRRGPQQTRLRTALAVSSDVLAGNKAAQAAGGQPVRESLLDLTCVPFVSDSRSQA
jgi:pyruvate dehydrogenase E1 component alpha subunit